MQLTKWRSFGLSTACKTRISPGCMQGFLATAIWHSRISYLFSSLRGSYWKVNSFSITILSHLTKTSFSSKVPVSSIQPIKIRPFSTKIRDLSFKPSRCLRWVALRSPKKAFRSNLYWLYEIKLNLIQFTAKKRLNRIVKLFWIGSEWKDVSKKTLNKTSRDLFIDKHSTHAPKHCFLEIPKHWITYSFFKKFCFKNLIILEIKDFSIPKADKISITCRFKKHGIYSATFKTSSLVCPLLKSNNK